MVIEFKITVDGSAGETAVQTPANVTERSPPAHKSLHAVYVPGSVANAAPVAARPATLASGSGAVFVIGPIVICGSGTAPTVAAPTAPDSPKANNPGKGKVKGALGDDPGSEPLSDPGP